MLYKVDELTLYVIVQDKEKTVENGLTALRGSLYLGGKMRRLLFLIIVVFLMLAGKVGAFGLPTTKLPEVNSSDPTIVIDGKTISGIIVNGPNPPTPHDIILSETNLDFLDQNIDEEGILKMGWEVSGPFLTVEGGEAICENLPRQKDWPTCKAIESGTEKVIFYISHYICDNIPNLNELDKTNCYIAVRSRFNARLAGNRTINNLCNNLGEQRQACWKRGDGTTRCEWGYVGAPDCRGRCGISCKNMNESWKVYSSIGYFEDCFVHDVCQEYETDTKDCLEALYNAVDDFAHSMDSETTCPNQLHDLQLTGDLPTGDYGATDLIRVSPEGKIRAETTLTVTP